MEYFSEQEREEVVLEGGMKCEQQSQVNKEIQMFCDHLETECNLPKEQVLSKQLPFKYQPNC